MPTCPACKNFTAEGTRFCPTCGQPVDPDATTIGASRPADLSRAKSREAGRHEGTAEAGRHEGTAVVQGFSPAGSHYTAGTLLAQRYRIVGLLGKGGMGEVYRADDLTLGQPVALKFIPRELGNDAARLAHFLDEVRAARQVSHANVCRVYDVSDTQDPTGGPGALRRFLTMEYVDGEDLSTSLRRIGRFPADKALEIARQLCAGLAAVHERGLLHRDLKPANVMLDGRGRVRLTDFGLAGEVRHADGAGGREVAGTPAYMAPELLRGGPATVHSDLYALGLVLYEVFTGKRAFEAASIVELREKQERSQPASLSSSAGELDPAIEEVIFRCLDANPERRPGSAIAVAAALPGGDPLAAALAAGETPSPAMVAAAGENQGLAIRPAVAWLVSCLVLLAAAVGFVAHDGFSRHVPFDYPPDVLANKAEEMLETFGYPERPVDRAFGFTWHSEYALYVDRVRRVADRWRPMQQGHEPGVLFWYRASDQDLVPRVFVGFSLGGGRVTPSDPPPMRVGDRRLWLDTTGRLTRYEAVPPQVEETPPATPPAPDWDRLFAAAGLERSRFVEAAPTWVPLAMADARAAWTGTRATAPETPLRLEAAAWRGRPVFFRVIGPWTRPERQEAAAGGTGAGIANAAVFVIVFVLAGVCAWLARRNMLQGRADRRGASRLALAVGALILLAWFLSADHVASTAEATLLIMGLAGALFSAGMAWILYVAFEPSVRRRWPHTVITWNRLLAGRVRDGLFGRDLLIGTTVGVGLGVLFFVQLAVARLVGPWAPEPVTPNFDPLLGTRLVAYAFVALLHSSIVGSLQIFSLIFVLVVALRRGWVAAAVFLAITVLQSLTGGTDPWLTLTIRISITAVMVFVLLRYGLVTFAVANFVLSTLGGGFPLSADLGRWYTGPSFVVWAGLAAVAVVGFRLAVGKQRLLAASDL